MKKIILLSVILSSMAFAALKDGTYIGESLKDSKGYTTKLEIVVKDGKITKAVIDDVLENGVLKRDGADAMKRWEERSKTWWTPAAENLEKQLIEKQDIAKVDMFAGATNVSTSFKKLGAALLKNAESGNTAKVVMDVK